MRLAIRVCHLCDVRTVSDVFHGVSMGQARADCLRLSHRRRGKGWDLANSHFIESHETIRGERRAARRRCASRGESEALLGLVARQDSARNLVRGTLWAQDLNRAGPYFT